MISFQTPKHHWNYFLAIESDLENLSRYIEFSSDNLSTYSIELTHLLLSSSSEIDVILKQICKILEPKRKANNIEEYKTIIIEKLPQMCYEEISIERFGLSFKPWENWLENNTPKWWKSHNNVKHQRNQYFAEANLQNTINSIGALLIVTTYYYKLSFEQEASNEVSFRDTTNQLQPSTSLVRINADYYFQHFGY